MSCFNFKQYSEPYIYKINSSGGDNGGGDNVYDKHYIHYQYEPSSEWHIMHNLKKYPSVYVLTTANEVVFGEVIHINNNYCKIKFKYNITGKAICN